MLGALNQEDGALIHDIRYEEFTQTPTSLRPGVSVQSCFPVLMLQHRAQCHEVTARSNIAWLAAKARKQHHALEGSNLIGKTQTNNLTTTSSDSSGEDETNVLAPATICYYGHCAKDAGA